MSETSECSSTSDLESNSSFDLEVEDDGVALSTVQGKHRESQYAKYLRRTKQPCKSALLPFDQLKRALHVLNHPPKFKASNRSCSGTQAEIGTYVDKTIGHYCSLIKRAILKHEWSKIPRLLIAYIDQEKLEKSHYGLIAKYGLIYLLNDPAAKKNKLLTELFREVLSSRKEEEAKKFFKLCISSPFFIQYKIAPKTND